jgi:hypothetical protein
LSVKGLSESESEVSQVIDLKSVTGVDLSDNPALVEEISQAIIDYTVERTNEGLGVGRKKLHSPYSKDYSESLDFKAAGKSKNDVNLRLSGDMLAAIDVLDVNGSQIKFGISDSTQAPKAFGHQSGFEGHPTIKGVKPRPFIGLTQAELKTVIEPYMDEIKAEKRSNIETTASLINLVRRVGDLFES